MKTKLWTKDFFLITFVSFFVALNFYLLMVVISVYAMDNFHSSPSEAGLAASIFIIGALIARLFSGRSIERIGRKKMLYMGVILNLIMSLMYFGVNNIMFLLVVRFLHGAAFGVTSTAAGTIVASIIPKARCGEGLGYYMLSVTLATAIGPFLGMLLNQYGSFNMIFVSCAISAAFNLVNTLMLYVPEMELTEEQLNEMKGFKFNNFFETRAIPISIVCAVIYFCYSSVLSFLTAYAKEINLMDAASFFFIIYAVVVLISRPKVGRLFDSKGENAAMYPAILIFMIGMIILSQAHQGYALLLAGAFIGLGSGAVQSISQAISVKVTPSHRLGLATSTFFMLSDVGMGIGPFIFGLFVPFTGYRGLYVCGGIVAFASLFLYYLVHGKNTMRVIKLNV